MIAILVVAAAVAQGDEIVARVGFHGITAAQIEARAQEVRGPAGLPAAADVLRRLVHEAMLAEDGLLRGLDQDPQVLARVRQEQGRMAVRRMIEREIGAAVRVRDHEVRGFWRSSAETVRLELLLLATRAQAEAAAARLRAGSTFAEEAKASLDAVRGGDQGEVTRAQVDPALHPAVFSAPPGKIAGPLKLPLGWAVLRVRERKGGDEKDWLARREGLRRFLEQQAVAGARRHFVRKLREKKGAQVDEAFLHQIGARVAFAPGEAERVVARAGEAQVSYESVARAVEQLVGSRQSGHFSGASVKIELAWELLDEALLEQAALDRGHGDAPAVREAAARARDGAVVDLTVDRLRAAAGPASDAETRAYYEANADDFIQPSRRSCSHIAVPSRAEAEGLKRSIERGAFFSELARRHSRDGATAEKGGALGELTDSFLADLSSKGGEPAFAQALREAPPGQAAGPVETRFGWHLVLCAPPLPAGRASLDEARPAVAARLSQQRTDDAVEKHLVGLRARMSVEVDQAALDRAAARLARLAARR